MTVISQELIPCRQISEKSLKAEVLSISPFLKVRYTGDFNFFKEFDTQPHHYRRADELWKGNCLEVFIGTETERYFEINLSPKNKWNCYEFYAYRQGMKASELITLEHIELEFNGIIFILNPSDLNIKTINITAVTLGDQISYWSSHHPKGHPDFHNQTYWHKV